MATPEAEELLKLVAGESSTISKSFWFGKLLQHLSVSWKDSRHSNPREEEQPTAIELEQDTSSQSVDLPCVLSVHTREALECLKHCETSLSPNVFQLIVKSVTDSTLDVNVPHTATAADSNHVHDYESHRNILISTHCTLNWAVVSKWLGEDVLQERKDYSTGARACVPISKLVHSELLKNAELISLLKREENFEWTPFPKLFSECLVELQESENCLRAHTCLLLGTAALERALGDVYVSVSRATQPPLLLRDLLATPELERAFGATAMCLLRCLIGPPSGLNLRNILWHGFAAPNEIPVEYVFLLFVIVSSLGLSFKTAHTTTTIHHRPFTTFPQEHQLAGVFEEFSAEELVVVEELFSESFFILPTMLPTWRAAIEAFRMKRFSHFFVLILPCLEHSLRRVFACVNGCPERTITAESSTLYTTFDEILSPLLSNGEENKLKDEIGNTKLEMLLDILVHPEGPRLRDRVSHGEVDFYSISGSLSNHVLCIGVLFCMKYSLTRTLLDTEPLARCLSVEQNYISIFHPISLLRRELEQLVLELDSWKEISRPDYWLEREEEGDKASTSGHTSTNHHQDAIFSALIQQTLESVHCHCLMAVPPSLDRLLSTSWVFGCVTELMDLVASVWDRPLDTLYVSRTEMELTGSMRRTVDNSHKAVAQIMETCLLRHKQYTEKQLRSRQRNNYDHLLASLHLYQSAMVLLITLLVTTVSHFPHCNTQDRHRHKTTIKFHKKLLQFSENFNSQSSPLRNRWEEVDRLCTGLAELVDKEMVRFSAGDERTVLRPLTN